VFRCCCACVLVCETIGISRNENFISLALLEFSARQALEPLATRAMVIVDPVRVVLTNEPEGSSETLQAPNMPKDASKGTHPVRFAREVFIERADVSAVDAGKDFFGLAPGKEVHLKYAYNIRATKVLTDAEGRVTEVHATVDRANTNKPKGKITWVSSSSSIDVELRLYDVLFKSADPMGLGSDEWLGDINPDSLVVKTAKADPSLNIAKPGQSMTHTHTHTHLLAPSLRPNVSLFLLFFRMRILPFVCCPF
jgi:glutaminyl-tRNA synthetase